MQVGARLISHAGSLTNLAKFPASTVQILGAEKALFRALKTRGNTPKYGLIYHSSFIGKAKSKDKGRVSRYLANKCSIATRLDCFSGTIIFPVSTSHFAWNMLNTQIEFKLEFCIWFPLQKFHLPLWENTWRSKWRTGWSSSKMVSHLERMSTWWRMLWTRYVLLQEYSYGFFFPVEIK